MKTAGPVPLVLVLLTTTWVSPMPTTESTTRRYTGYNTHNETLSISNNNTTRSHFNTRFTTSHLRDNRLPNRSFYTFLTNDSNANSSFKTIRKPIRSKITRVNVSKISIKPDNETKLIKGFIRNNYEVDANVPNKTIKVVVINDNKRKVDLTVKPAKKPSIITISPFKKQTNQTNRVRHKTTTTTALKSTKHTTTKPKFSPRPIKENKILPNVNGTALSVLAKKKKRKPTVHKVINKWSDKPPYNNLKESWHELGIPVPTPDPEIVTYSPQHAINDGLPVEVDDVEYESPQISLPEAPPGNPLNYFTLDVNGDDLKDGIYAADGLASGCPTVHLSNAIFGPTSKQDCSDLNIAINTHLNQNPAPVRRPEVQGDPLEAASSGTPSVAVPPNSALADSYIAPIEGVAADAVGSSVPAGGAASSGGSGGGLPSLPGLPEFPGKPHLPDLKGLADLLRMLGNVLSFLRGVLAPLAPLLYIIPFLSFALGFISVLPFYPWWLPFLFVGGKKKNPPPPDIVFHNHVHKPIYHGDGWFWNHNTKSWTNVDDYIHRRTIKVRYPYRRGRTTDVLRQTEEFPVNYGNETQNSQSWKRRKK